MDIAWYIGIIFAGIIAVNRQTMPKETQEYITREICLPFLIQQQRMTDYDATKLLNNLKNDKKRTGAGLPMVYPEPGGLCKTQDLTEDEFHSALTELKKILFEKL